MMVVVVFFRVSRKGMRGNGDVVDPKPGASLARLAIAVPRFDVPNWMICVFYGLDFFVTVTVTAHSLFQLE